MVNSCENCKFRNSCNMINVVGYGICKYYEYDEGKAYGRK